MTPEYGFLVGFAISKDVQGKPCEVLRPNWDVVNADIASW